MIISGLRRNPIEHFTDDEINEKLMIGANEKYMYGGSVYIHPLKTCAWIRPVMVGNFISLSKRKDEETDGYILFFKPTRSGEQYIREHFKPKDNAVATEYVIPGSFMLGMASKGRYTFKIEYLANDD